jgi:primosomal protein N' (replication factor Y)
VVKIKKEEEKKTLLWVECLLPLPLESTFTYEIQAGVKGWQAGMDPLLCRVWLNFNGRREWALVTKIVTEKPAYDCKPVLAFIDPKPLIPDSYIHFLKELSSFYICSLGEAMALALPSGKREKHSLKEKEGDADSTRLPASRKYSLSPKQQESITLLIEKAQTNMKQRTVSLELLFGITGSGKTEVYLTLIENLLQADIGTILLVPEIGLSAQLLEKVKERFGFRVAWYHSRLTREERFQQWLKVLRGEARIVVGTRSAIFLPVQNLGLVILDEEHEASYKEHSTPRYHARQVAQFALKKNGGMILMGSATPAIETFYWARTGRIGLFNLPERVTPNPLAHVEIADIAKDYYTKSKIFSSKLIEGINETMAKGNQAILLLNRRGYSPVVRCLSCLQITQCPNCEVTLSLHKGAQFTPAANSKEDLLARGILKCHYCGFQKSMIQKCPYCGSQKLSMDGSGVQRVEDEIRQHFKDLRIQRLDLDTVRKVSFEETLKSFERREIDILLGTQMIAKGLDLPGVTFVGVILADVGLGLPDFRAAERTFSLLTQVAGRSGRGREPGKVLIQTYQSEHPVMTFALKQDYLGFFNQEILQRKRLNYPPFSRLIRIVIRGKDDEKAKIDAQKLGEMVKLSYGKKGLLPADIPLLGPVPAPFFRLNNNYRYHLLLKESNVKRGIEVIKESLKAMQKTKGIYREIDIDPLDIL